MGRTSRSLTVAISARTTPQAPRAWSRAARPAAAVHPLAIEAVAEIGIDISGQRSKGLDEYLGKVHFGFLITVCDRAAATCPTFPGVGRRLHWSLEDPAAATGTRDEQLAVFRASRDQLAEFIDTFAAEQS